MNSRTLRCLLLVTTLSCLFPAGAAAASPDVVGSWGGEVALPGAKLAVVFTLSAKPDGSLGATFTVPAQGVRDLALDQVSYSDGRLHLGLTSAGFVFDGVLAPGGKDISGTFVQAGMEIPLTLARTEGPAVSKRPQEPERPYPYKDEEVVYPNQAAGIKLAGTLTLPAAKGPFPAVILITGSGPQDRDETVFGHKPFLVLADYLTRRGFAVLRVDDRGVGGSTGSTMTSTSRDFAGDVRAGLAYLKSRADIDPRRIGLIGHSEGGLIAPLVAADSRDVAFIVLLAGPGLPGEQLMILQGRLIGQAQGATAEQLARAEANQRALFGLMKQETDDAKAIELATQMIMKQLSESQLTEEQKKAMGDPEKYSRMQAQGLINPWFRFFLTYDPLPTLARVKCPVLALNGSKDLQVPPQEDLQAISDTLKAAGNDNVTAIELPGLNHVFQTATTGSPSEYGEIPETMSPVALKVIADWLSERAALR